YFEEMKKNFSNVELSYFQSNIEGEIVDKIQEADYSYDGIVINAGGYSHTSVAIRDALAAVSTPAVEVHISNVFAREDFRHTLLIAPVCRGCITGMGLKGYYMAVESFVEKK
ncbi:MAG: 3-dehydroquinate dehydratase, partial [Bacteroidales bacterium]|nr:3-dehydroquinate dehydratase [Bacteroidales bacterium]